MNAKDAPAFDFYPERWIAGVAMLSDAEQLAFLRLLCQQWLAGDEGLPADPVALKRAAGKGVTPVLLEKFPLCEDGRRRNAKLERIRAEQRERITKKSEQRRAAAMRRWHPSESGKDAAAMRPHDSRTCGQDAGGMPTTHHPPLYSESNTQRESSDRSPRVPAGTVRTPTLLEVEAWAGAVMAPPECAECFHADHEARPLAPSGHWTDRDGNPVANPAAAFRAFATRWKSNAAERRQPRSLLPIRPARPADVSDVKPSNLREL